MYMMKRLRNFFLLSLILFFHGQLKAANTSFSLKGIVEVSQRTMVVVTKISAQDVQVVDTVYTTKKGKFSYEANSPEDHLYYLTFGSAQPPGVPVVLKNGDQVKIEVSLEDGFPYQIEGGRWNNDMYELHKIYTHYDTAVKNFTSRMKSLDPADFSAERQNQINAEYLNLISSRTEAVEEFTESHEGSPVLFFAARFLFSRPEPRIVNKVLDKLKETMPDSEYTQALLAIQSQFKPWDEGMMAPDIRLENIDGDTISLSSLKGKVVLIDFWASWCGPCRKANPHVKAVYDKYKGAGFEILGVSLDHNRAQWQIAVMQDQLSWIHVSDLKGWKSSAAALYDVHSVPQTFLIDQDGRIHRANVHTTQLDQEIQNLLYP